MAKEWDYANMAHLAKENGGPEKFLSTIKMYNYQQGVEMGENLQQPKIVLALGIGAALCFAILQVPKAIHYFSRQSKEKKIMLEDAEIAEKMLLDEIKKVESPVQNKEKKEQITI